MADCPFSGFVGSALPSRVLLRYLVVVSGHGFAHDVRSHENVDMLSCRYAAHCLEGTPCNATRDGKGPSRFPRTFSPFVGPLSFPDSRLFRIALLLQCQNEGEGLDPFAVTFAKSPSFSTSPTTGNSPVSSWAMLLRSLHSVSYLTPPWKSHSPSAVSTEYWT